MLFRSACSKPLSSAVERTLRRLLHPRALRSLSLPDPHPTLSDTDAGTNVLHIRLVRVFGRALCRPWLRVR